MTEQDIKDTFALNCNMCSDKNGNDVTEKVVTALHQKLKQALVDELERLLKICDNDKKVDCPCCNFWADNTRQRIGELKKERDK